MENPRERISPRLGWKWKYMESCMETIYVMFGASSREEGRF
jgi:hypothetical protein